jgi:hypothetical protein
MISMKAQNTTLMSRRKLAAVLLSPAPLSGQAPAAPAADELQAARQRTQRTAETLRKFKVPIATEPSFAFKP